MTEWLGMDGYAAFVWPAYLLTLVCVGGLVLHAVLRRRATAKRLAELEQVEGEA
ncbi:heme exporter protein CcmD [Maricaulaceae bacterium EIL42A08]|nr:heme exporter protein CcmD [Maricaulaceae bacterium EIL42A08]MCP2680133.1 heme exporter protein CcmD [Maricaulaceae bacterium NA33B04]